MTRIINRQRQLAEQGRLRLGYTVPAKTRDGRDTTRPVRSETWILTSHSREHIEHAATLWGGTAEEWEPMGNGARQWRVITTARAIDAILPPGDPLTQAYEMWSKGGCQRRCNGATESFSGSPCLCLQQFGDQWYERSAREVCVSKSRLKVLLPDMPGLGSWRMETGSFYATDEIAGMVDTIRSAVGGQVLVPVTLRIEPRTRVAHGETKQFVVPVVELRGVTAGALLSGEATRSGQLAVAAPVTTGARALEAGAGDPYVEWREALTNAESKDQLNTIWTSMVAEKLLGHEAVDQAAALAFKDEWVAKATVMPDVSSVQGDAGEVVDGEIVDEPAGDPDVLWQQILAAAGAQGMTTADLEDDFAATLDGVTAADASAGDMRRYLDALQGRAA